MGIYRLVSLRHTLQRTLSGRYCISLLAKICCTLALPVVLSIGGCSSSSVPANDAGNITDQRFEAVRQVFDAQGVRAERDPTAKNTVRIYLPTGATLGLSKEKAKALASETRSRLGDKAIVYVKNENGDTLAKAAPWGLE